ncbi:MAG: ATP-binding protein [Candidatus Zixiibacteriota bacterium]|nr:MAG: ATP-binding protein [candidate division Zixibacteria bacterium]
MTDNNRFSDSLTFPSTTDQVAKADEFLETWLRKIGVPEDTIANLAIAVTELVNNAIVHGNKLKRNKKVTVSLTFDSGMIKITVADEGEGFNPENVPDPLAKENLMKEIGRGIFIVNSLIDEVKFQFPPGGGTKVTITKNIA